MNLTIILSSDTTAIYLCHAGTHYSLAAMMGLAMAHCCTPWRAHAACKESTSSSTLPMCSISKLPSAMVLIRQPIAICFLMNGSEHIINNKTRKRPRCEVAFCVFAIYIFFLFYKMPNLRTGHCVFHNAFTPFYYSMIFIAGYFEIVIACSINIKIITLAQIHRIIKKSKDII